MFLAFDVPLFLGWLLLSAFLPGAILSFSIFRKDDFSFIEKLLIGFALGWALLPLIPFLLYLAAGVKFSYSIALLSVAILYLVAIAFFVKNKAYEDIKGLKLPASITINPKALAIPICLVALLVVSYLIRLGSYSPIFQELDPYYYTYVSQQLLTLGENPFNDQTAWYPDLQVSHRAIPALSYLEATWYSLYTQGGQYNNMLLADIASMYPPLAAMLAVFFIYLLVSVVSKREWGLVAAALAAFEPVFIYKLAAGEQEVQAYAFFALAFFYAMYAFSMRKNDLRFPVLAGLAFAVLAMGSSSQIVAIIGMTIFVMAQALILFFRDKDAKGLYDLIVANAIVFFIGPLLGSAILHSLFETGTVSLSMMVPPLAAIVFAGALYALKTKVEDRERSMMMLAALVFLGILIYAFTPVGGYIRTMGKAAFETVEYLTPLSRTIAEQGLAGTTFGRDAGFIAETYDAVAATLLTPITVLLNTSSPASSTSLVNAVGTVFAWLFMIFSYIGNMLLALFVGLVNIVLGTSVSFEPKANSFLFFWLCAFLAAAGYGALKFSKKEDDGLFLLFLAMILPPLVVGLIKAKYTIYAGVLLAIAIGFAFAQADRIIGTLKNKDSMRRNLMILAAAVVFLQFIYSGFATSLLWGSFQQLYQDNPDALAPKFQQFCHQTNDSEVCAAAAAPMGYANNGTNYQYNYKLCFLSVLSNYSYLGYLFDNNGANDALVPSWEAQTATFRCQRLSEYWVDSMEWIRNSTEPGARISSWWDYGHWTNFFGQRNTVLRNEHASLGMIGGLAKGYLDSTPEELKAWMIAHDSKYALFDVEIDGIRGGKYGALNYLSCAYSNQTNVSMSPSESQCEADHLWETVYLSSNPCVISSLSNKSGLLAYKTYLNRYKQDSAGNTVFIGTMYSPSYPGDCINPKEQEQIAFCKAVVKMEPAYCVGKAMLADGQETYTTYSLNETYPNGDLKLNKAFLELAQQVPGTYNLGDVVSFTLFYTNDQVWLENGQLKSGYEDRKGKYYDSAVYRGMFLNELPGFTLAYTAPGGAVKIYKMNDMNSTG